MIHFRCWLDQISVLRCSVESAPWRILVPPQGQFPVHPAQARRRRGIHMRVLDTKESLPPLDALEDFERAQRLGRRTAELLELVMHPVQQQDLSLELIPSGRDNRIKLVALPQFLQFGIGECVEPEQLCILALHVGQRIELPDGRRSSPQLNRRRAGLRQTGGRPDGGDDGAIRRIIQAQRTGRVHERL